MANKDRNKRSARKARAAERQEREAQQAAQAAAAAPAKESRITKAISKDKGDKSVTKSKKAKEDTKKPGRIRTWLREVRTEMHRVISPSREELINYSMAALGLLVVFGVVIWLVDTGIVALLAAYTGLRG